VAGAAAGALALAARRGWLTGWRPEPRWLRIAIPVVAVLVTGMWFLSYIQTASTICTYGDCYNSAFMADETFAVLNGLTPLVDHTAAYGSLWPFVFAPLMLVLGKTLLVWTILMWGLTVAMLLAIYGVLRRATHSSIAALALFLPVMTFTYYAGSRDLDHPIAIYQQVPMRTAGPFIVAWLVARRLDRGRGAIWPLALAAGLAALNNADFGLAALGATAAALLWTAVPLTRERLARLAGGFVLGLAGAWALVAVVTLIRAGALPNPAKAVEFARIYTRSGVGVWPLLRIIGLPLAIYLTYAAAIGVATVRAIRGAPDRTLTGMLVWSGIFGLGSAAYYMGASTILAIATLFPAWGLSLALLTIVAVRHVATRRERIPSVPALAALFGIALIGTFVFMPPARLAPWTQIERIESDPVYAPDDAEPLEAPSEAAFKRFVSSTADGRGRFVMRSGAPVAFLTATGHLLADAYDIRDVVPYTGRSVFTADQLDQAIERLHAAGGNTVLVPMLILERVAAQLNQRGFEVLTSSGYRAGMPGRSIPTETLVVHSAGIYLDELTKWVDRRALHPGA
jgi:ribosome modulation factor